MPDLLWESELPAGGGGGRFQLYRVADESLHLTYAEEVGCNLTPWDVGQLLKVLAFERIPDARLRPREEVSDDARPVGPDPPLPEGPLPRPGGG